MSEQNLWHYTDSAGAIGILSTNSLWATSLAHLNDSSELEYGLQVVVDELEKRARKEVGARVSFLGLFDFPRDALVLAG